MIGDPAAALAAVDRVASIAKKSGAAAAAAPAKEAAAPGGHTPESIARLPPKLRARLLARGIIKAEDCPGGSAAAAPGTPPESPADKAAAAAAALHAAASSMQASFAAAASNIPGFAKSASPAGAPAQGFQGYAKSAPAAAPAALAAAPTQTVFSAAPTKTVFSAAPQLKRAAGGAADAPDAKRQTLAEAMAAAASPAAARAAAAQADGSVSWTFESTQGAAVAASASGFVPCPTFAGAKPGMAFKKGDEGMGYYPDQVAMGINIML